VDRDHGWRDRFSTPAVANNVVYVGSRDAKLYAFDATGTTNCSGTPKTCQPLWTAASGGVGISSSPVVVNGVVYIGSTDHNLYAYDATGTTNCSGTPKTCQPLWKAVTGSDIESSPAVVNGVVYIGSEDKKLYAYAANGQTNCSGTPKVCTPLWTATTGSFVVSSPAIANGVVYAASFDGNLYAFDAAGKTNCSGTPKTCQPLWKAGLNSGGANVLSSPAIANGVVYIGSPNDDLYAFDANGKTNCSGTPKSCQPLWSAVTAGAIQDSPGVANGVVYIQSDDGNIYAYDASGTLSCSGAPKICAPLWNAVVNGDESSPTIANGTVFAGSAFAPTDQLYAFQPQG
jgi:outer membrane protein assembly factor BamB